MRKNRENNITMGYQLKLIRNAARITQSTAAKKVYGIPQGNLSSIENNRIIPSIEHVTAAYYSMGYYMNLEEFLLDSWLNQIIKKKPYNNAFENVEKLKKTILHYAKRYPHYRIKKGELLKFYKDPSKYILPKDAEYIVPLIFNNNDFIREKVNSYDKNNNIKKIISNMDDPQLDSVIYYLEQVIDNLNALLSIFKQVYVDNKQKEENDEK